MSDSFPLSPLQQGMLFHYLREPHAGVDIEQVVVRLPQKIDAGKLQEAWKRLAARHEMLRARFVWEGVDEPAQDIAPVAAAPFDVQKTVEADLEAFLSEDRVRGFDLNSAPLMRLKLFEWSATSYALVWTFHHALLDGRCYATLLREVFETYDELCAGVVRERPEPPSYRRFISWLRGQKFEEAEGYWKRTLAGFTAATPLVVDLKNRVETRYAHGEVWEALDAATTARLRGILEPHGLNLNALVMSSWAVLLHRYSGEGDIVFGATRACRKSSVPDADDMIGPFINTVPVRVRLSSEDRMLDTIQRVRSLWLEMRPHEHTPLGRVKSVSEVRSASPLFDSLVVFENQRLDDTLRKLGGEWASRKVELYELTNFALTLAAYDGEALSFKMEFHRDRFHEQTVRGMLHHLRNLMEGFAADTEATVESLPLLDAAETAELVATVNTPAAPSRSDLPLDGSATLHEVFENRVRQQPDAVALTCDGDRLTYAGLNARANRVARRLRAFGVGPDTLVGLYLDRSNDLVVAILAILKSGGAYLPIDLSYPAERIRFMLEDAQAPIVLTQKKLSADVPATTAKVLCLEDLAENTQDDSDLPPASDPDCLAYVIYTSGTTGKPKGSFITHRNVARLFASTDDWFRFNNRDVWTLFHSCAFDFSVWEIWGALLYGGRLVVIPFAVSRSPEAFYQVLGDESVTVLNQTPSAFRQLIQAETEAPRHDLRLRYIVFGGEALEMESLRPWFDRHGDREPRLINMYGITETTVHVTYRPLSKDDLQSGSVIGVPIPDLQVYVLDQQKRLVPAGVPGEMYVGGAGLARGYLRRPELTADRFIPDHITGKPGSRLYRTGDLGRLLPGRDIEYLGRIDQQVKIRGFRIELGEVQSALLKHPAVREAVVAAREDALGHKRLVGYVVASEPLPEVTALRNHLKLDLPEYMVPAAFVFLEKLPLTNNGKIDQRALPAPEEHRPELAARYVAPRTQAEAKLAAIWTKVLGVERVGVNDNFFELGGDSILSIRIISLARSEGIEITPRLLFQNQTIAELMAVAGAAPQAPPSLDNASGEVPLTPIQHWFFEQNLMESHHYNQAFLVEMRAPLEREALTRALAALAAHHDALRLRFTPESGVWRQRYEAAEKSAPVEWVDLSGVEDSEKQKRLEERAAVIQGSLNPATGPLWRAAHFHMGAGMADRLLLTVHHLAIDGVSWRILFEDLQTAYRQAKAGASVLLPSKTTSFKTWAGKLIQFAGAAPLQTEAAYWKNQAAGALALPDAGTEGDALRWTSVLGAEETRTLLQRVPAAYNTQINDVLLTALARAWQAWSGNRAVAFDLEGHGREDIFPDVDLSRTVGWFTSIFPVRLELPEDGASWNPADALKSVKEQLRCIPCRGIGYGILRYLARDKDLADPDPPLVFNYLGQFDQMLAGSQLFHMAKESAGPWHSPRQKLRHAMELNGVVLDGRLEFWWAVSGKLADRDVKGLSETFMSALRELIAHCTSAGAGGRTPSDFPLARLNQPALDGLYGAYGDVEDLYPLAPIQTLFLSVGASSGQHRPDHWHCGLEGELDVAAFQRAWQETLGRHSILRSTLHSEGLPEPVQIVHRHPEPKWTVENWEGLMLAQQEESWRNFLAEDRARPVTLTEAPVMRFTLIRLSSRKWKFLWSVPALVLDGWSWPVVFRDASRIYQTLWDGRTREFEPVRPYRDYIDWLRRQNFDDARRYWKETMAGYAPQPRLLSAVPEAAGGGGERFVECGVRVSADTTRELHAVARKLHLTLNSVIQSAWAILLHRQSGAADIVFGSAFSGRPADLPRVESIVGPFVNNLPVRVSVESRQPLENLLRSVHGRLLEINPHQFIPLSEIQQVSGIPWRYRLFDSLVVFQNYLVDSDAQGFGDAVRMENFAGPIHTNYPVLLLAEPGTRLRLTLIYDRNAVPAVAAEQWAEDMAILLETIPAALADPIATVAGRLSPPAAKHERRNTRQTSRNFVRPQTAMEVSIAQVWQNMFGLDQVGIEENFFDLGGHSLLLVQMHGRLRETLQTEFSVVRLFEYPTIRSLARYLSGSPEESTETSQQWRDRAHRQKQALARMRIRSKQ